MNSKKKQMIINSDYSQLEEVRKFVAQHASQYGFPDEEAFRIALAVDEACTNIIRYTFRKNSSHKIKIEINKIKNRFEIEVIDNGNPFNPSTVPPVNLEEYRQEYKKGGLGIQIMRSIMDKIEYKPATSEVPYNILKLKKNMG
jgi:anti-sigma regulatory factor (Ser/Thr protein kinase)